MNTNGKRDYYEVLGVGRAASDQEIKSAYRKLAMQCHPDRNPGDPTAEERFKEVTEAYGVLADAEKRAAYDRFGHAGVGTAASGGMGFDPSIFQDFSDIFGDFFGFSEIFGGGAGRRRTRAQRGADLRHDLNLEFEEAVFGAKTQIKTRHQETCEACRGTGSASGKPATCSTCAGRGQVRYQQNFFSIARTCPACQGVGTVITDPCVKCKGHGRVARERVQEIKVPAGVENGTRIRFSGMGDAGLNGGQPGDLYVVLHVKEHPFFAREGNDLFCVVPISFTQASLGAELQIPTLDGEHLLRIPEGTQSGREFRIRGKGVPVLNGHGKGDLIVTIVVQTPTKLNKRQRELLEELGQLSGIENKPERPSLLSKVKDMFG